MSEQTIRVMRGRMGWAPGYFDGLRGERIPFPEHGLESPARPMTGILEAVSETERWISLTFSDVRPEGAML